MSKIIVGLGGLLSDAGCCVIKNGQLASAVEQSKVRRSDRRGQFADEAFSAALAVAKVEPEEIDCLAVARPFARGAESDTHLALRSRLPNAEIVVVEHHTAHAASAYFASGFEHAKVLSVDRAGDFRSAVLFEAAGNQMTPVRELYFPDSLGELFSRVTQLLGYEPRSDEHKVQWLSATAQPLYKDVFMNVLHSGGSAWPQIDRTYLDGDRLAQGGFSAKFSNALGMSPGETIDAPKQAAIACSLQKAINETVVRMLLPAGNACIAGGVALNALLISSLERVCPNVFVQPAAGNAGTAIGAALHAWHSFYQQQQRIPFNNLYLGPEYSAEQIKKVLENCKLRFRFLLTEGEIIEQALKLLGEEKIVAWMHGRMEFGPRALGNRSLLASPLSRYSTENLNVFIKHREATRKFAASVPAEAAAEYFEVGANARFLATVGRVRPHHRETFQSAILGNDLIRVHTVDKAENPLYHSLLVAAGKATGLPVLYNTSFNLFGDPLVCTPRDAVRSFYSSGVDAMFVGNFFLEK